MGLRGRAAAVALAALAAAGCGSGAGTTGGAARPRSASPFRYDASAPLAYRNAGRVNSAYPIAVDDVSYAAPGGRVEGYLALPPGKGRVPAVIYLHGSGESRERFLLPAVWTAGRRAVGMTLTLPSSSAGPPPSGLTPAQSLERDRRIFAADVIAVRRAVDVLVGLPQVDPKRIGLVGWSLGARVAAVTAGAEPRIRATVLMSGGSPPVSAYVSQAPAALRSQVRSSLTQIDPLRWVARARPGSVMLQDGRRDEIVPRAALLALARAAPRGSVLRWYPAGHELDAQAYFDQLAFLQRKLPIRRPERAGGANRPVIDSPHGGGTPGAEGRDRALCRPRRLHLARGAARSRGRRRRARPLPRTRAGRAQALRRDGREAHRRRRDGALRRADDPRGRRGAGGQGCLRDPGLGGGRGDRGADRDQHGRGARPRRRPTRGGGGDGGGRRRSTPARVCRARRR